MRSLESDRDVLNLNTGEPYSNRLEYSDGRRSSVLERTHEADFRNEKRANAPTMIQLGTS